MHPASFNFLAFFFYSDMSLGNKLEVNKLKSHLSLSIICLSLPFLIFLRLCLQMQISLAFEAVTSIKYRIELNTLLQSLSFETFPEE